MYNKNYELWKNANLEQELKDELNNLTEEKINEAFYKDLDFGTGGLRGIMGVGTNRINSITIKKSTKGYADYLNENFTNPSVAISYDNRINSKKYANIAARVLAANNIKTYLVSELRPTPYLSFLIRHFKTSGGIMITASHNPKEYNGYKVYEPHGGQLNLENSEKVIKKISEVTNIFDIKELDNNLINVLDLNSLDTIYLDLVKGIELNKFSNPATILYSPLHGTGSTLIPRLLEELSYNYYSFLPHMINDGNFPNTRSSNPEEKIAYIDPIEYAKEIKADSIILTDPDADRIGAAVYHNGEYIILNGNQIAVITLNYLLENKKDIKNGYIFMSNVTTDLIKVIGESYNINVVKTLPGFKFIAEQMGKLDKESTYVFGCEESNGNIISPFVRDKDAVQATLMLSEISSYVKANNMSMIDYLDNIYQKYGYFIEDTLSFNFKGIDGPDKMNDLMEYLRANHLEINGFELESIEDNKTMKITNLKTNEVKTSSLAKSNIIKFVYSDKSWIMARPSGTEPKLKIYISVNDKNISNSKNKHLAIKEVINNLINNN